MEKYFEDILTSVYEISDQSRDKFFNFYNIILKIIQEGIGKTTINPELLSIYPVGEYALNTSIEEVTPFKIIFEYVCKRSELAERIKYLKLKNKKKKSLKDEILMTSASEKKDHVYTNFELAQLIQSIINRANYGFSTTIKQNNLICRMRELDKVYDFVIVVAYRFIKEENEMDNEIKETQLVDNILFKYRYENYNMNYTKFLTNFEKKNEDTKGIYNDVIMLFKYMEFDLLINEKVNHKTFTIVNLYENLLYNVPDIMYTDDLLQSVKNCANYLYNVKSEDLKSLDDLPLVNNKTDKVTYREFLKMISSNITKYFKEYKEYFE